MNERSKTGVVVILHVQTTSVAFRDRSESILSLIVRTECVGCVVHNEVSAELKINNRLCVCSVGSLFTWQIR